MSTEAMEQEGLLIWFHQKYPDVLIYHCPNGEYRSPSVAARLKKQGVVPGIPDLFIPSWKIYIEMKKKEGGIVSKEQRIVMDYLTRVGYTVIIGYGAEDASRKILDVI